MKIAKKQSCIRCLYKFKQNFLGLGCFYFYPHIVFIDNYLLRKKNLNPYIEQQDRIECFPQQLNCTPQTLEFENLCTRNLKCEAAKYRSGKKFKISR